MRSNPLVWGLCGAGCGLALAGFVLAGQSLGAFSRPDDEKKILHAAPAATAGPADFEMFQLREQIGKILQPYIKRQAIDEAIKVIDSIGDAGTTDGLRDDMLVWLLQAGVEPDESVDFKIDDVLDKSRRPAQSEGAAQPEIAFDETAPKNARPAAASIPLEKAEMIAAQIRKPIRRIEAYCLLGESYDNAGRSADSEKAFAQALSELRFLKNPTGAKSVSYASIGFWAVGLSVLGALSFAVAASAFNALGAALSASLARGVDRELGDVVTSRSVAAS